MKWLLIMAMGFSALQGQIRAVIFDWGGVMYDGERCAIMSEIEQRSGIPVDALLHESVRDLRAQLRCGHIDDETFWQAVSDYAGKPLPADWIVQLEEVWTQYLLPVEGMSEVVMRVQEKGLMTPMLSDIHPLGARLNRQAGHYDLFDPVVLSCEVGMSKPGEEIFVHLLEELELAPHECLFIDDRSNNIQAADSLGIHTIQFTGKEALVVQLEEYGL